MAVIAFALILGGTILGSIARARLPEHHTSGDSKEVIRLATALVGTLTAVVLALLFASTRTAFEQTSGYVTRLAIDMTELDDLLAEYGPEAAPLRKQLRAELGPLIDSIWRDDAIEAGRPITGLKTNSETTRYMLRELKPQNAVQESLKAHALQVSLDITQIRVGLIAQPPDSSSRPFMTVVVLWLVFIFTTFSMSAKPNPTLTTVLFICILSASGAIYLVLELGLPFGGLMQVPNHLLRSALPPI